MKSEKRAHDTRKMIYFERFPAGYYELKCPGTTRSQGQVGLHALFQYDMINDVIIEMKHLFVSMAPS